VVTHAIALPRSRSNRDACCHLDQDLLGYLFRLARISHHSPDRAEHRRSDAPANGLESLPVAPGRLEQQRRQLGLAAIRAGLGR